MKSTTPNTETATEAGVSTLTFSGGWNIRVWEGCKGCDPIRAAHGRGEKEPPFGPRHEPNSTCRNRRVSTHCTCSACF